MRELREIMDMDKDTMRINAEILRLKENGWSAKGISDEWHTFEELYYHRMILFLALMKAYPEKAWRAELHHDGTMFEDSFIVGLETPAGQYSYHYNIEFWDKFDGMKTYKYAPEYDGHLPEDIERVLTIGG